MARRSNRSPDFSLFAIYDGVREWCHDLGEENRERRMVMENHRRRVAIICVKAEITASVVPNSIG
jgi:hypothetical protein